MQKETEKTYFMLLIIYNVYMNMVIIIKIGKCFAIRWSLNLFCLCTNTFVSHNILISVKRTFTVGINRFQTKGQTPRSDDIIFQLLLRQLTWVKSWSSEIDAWSATENKTNVLELKNENGSHRWKKCDFFLSYRAVCVCV